MAQATSPGFLGIFSAVPASAILCAIGFGFAWAFGAVFLGSSVSRLGVSVANTLVIGLSSALGSLMPLAFKGKFVFGRQQLQLYLGVLAFLSGCGSAEGLLGFVILSNPRKAGTACRSVICWPSAPA
jgi:L-rhamnose-H+ transport protein